MRIDPILEELYQTRAQIMREANNDPKQLMEQLRAFGQAQRKAHPEIKWVDYKPVQRKPISKATQS